MVMRRLAVASVYTNCETAIAGKVVRKVAALPVALLLCSMAFAQT